MHVKQAAADGCIDRNLSHQTVMTRVTKGHNIRRLSAVMLTLLKTSITSPQMRSGSQMDPGGSADMERTESRADRDVMGFTGLSFQFDTHI